MILRCWLIGRQSRRRELTLITRAIILEKILAADGRPCRDKEVRETLFSTSATHVAHFRQPALRTDGLAANATTPRLFCYARSTAAPRVAATRTSLAIITPER